MEVKAEITSKSLTNGIKFHGESNADGDTVERIKELQSLLEDVLYDFNELYYQVHSRQEYSAKEIAEQLDITKKDLKALYFDGEE